MKEKDNKKIDGPHIYFSEKEDKTNTIENWYFINFRIVVIYI